MFLQASVILSLLSLGAGSVIPGSQTVKLSVYYESLCPDSINFVKEQLFPSWQHLGVETLKLDLNPFGKANVRYFFSQFNLFKTKIKS